MSARPWWVYVIQSQEPRHGKQGQPLPGWQLRAVYGPYANQSQALKAERALKRGKRSTGRLQWSTADSEWCCGMGVAHPWVTGQTASR